MISPFLMPKSEFPIATAWGFPVPFSEENICTSCRWACQQIFNSPQQGADGHRPAKRADPRPSGPLSAVQPVNQSPHAAGNPPRKVSLDISQVRTVQRFPFEKSFEDQPMGQEMKTEGSGAPCP